MSASVHARDLVLTREVVIKDEVTGAVLAPKAMVRADDGGFIIAGRINPTQEAWATKINAEGKVLWRYQIKVKDKLPIGQGAQFSGVAAMPDGSSFMCGHMPVTPGGHVPGLLVHLDRAGKPLSEQLLVPEHGPARGVASFHDCARWGDGVVVVGKAYQFHGGGRSDRLYWLVALDNSGKKKWERLLPTSFDAIDWVGPILVRPDSSLVFSGSRAVDGTELNWVSSTGEVRASKKLPGSLALVRSVEEDGLLQVSGSVAQGVYGVVTLNEELEEIGRVEGRHPRNFGGSVAYRLPDRSFVWFGTGYNTFGPRYTTRVVHVDPRLTSETALDLPRKQVFDSGQLTAAAPASTPGAFVAARDLLSNTNGNIGRLGAGLAFIQVTEREKK